MSGKYGLACFLFICFISILSVLFSSWRCLQLGGRHRLVPADDRLWSWSRPDLRVFENTGFWQGQFRDRNETKRGSDGPYLGCKRVNRKKYKHMVFVSLVFGWVESISLYSNWEFFIAYLRKITHFGRAGGVKACCALVDAWGSKGEAQKAAEILEELEAWRGWLFGGEGIFENWIVFFIICIYL